MSLKNAFITLNIITSYIQFGILISIKGKKTKIKKITSRKKKKSENMYRKVTVTII